MAIRFDLVRSYTASLSILPHLLGLLQDLGEDLLGAVDDDGGGLHRVDLAQHLGKG